MNKEKYTEILENCPKCGGDFYIFNETHNCMNSIEYYYECNKCKSKFRQKFDLVFIIGNEL